MHTIMNNQCSLSVQFWGPDMTKVEGLSYWVALYSNQAMELIGAKTLEEAKVQAITCLETHGRGFVDSAKEFRDSG